MLPDDLAWIVLNNKIALKQPLIKTEQNKLTFKLSGNTINIFISATKLLRLARLPDTQALFHALCDAYLTQGLILR